jgi:phenazine biosynthesis protein phzE
MVCPTMRGPGFASMQFHAESVLTIDGPRIVGQTIREVFDRAG